MPSRVDYSGAARSDQKQTMAPRGVTGWAVPLTRHSRNQEAFLTAENAEDAETRDMGRLAASIYSAISAISAVEILVL